MSQRKSRSKPGSHSPRFTWAQAFRDIVIRLIDKGAILPGTISAICLLIVWRLESHDAHDVFMGIITRFSDYSLVGWCLSLAVTLVWQAHIRRIRKTHSTECSRLGREKSQLQRRLSNVKLGSSDAK